MIPVGERIQIEQGEYRSQARPKAVLNSLSAFEARYNVPVVFSPTPATSAALVESWAYWIARELVEQANNLMEGARMMNQIYGVSRDLQMDVWQATEQLGGFVSNVIRPQMGGGGSGSFCNSIGGFSSSSGATVVGIEGNGMQSALTWSAPAMHSAIQVARRSKER